MIAKLQRLTALLLLAFGLPACATITSGTTQSVSVMTEPAGAACTLTREGAVVGIVNPTPGTVSVSKSSRDIAIRCTRTGYSAGAGVATPQIQAMTAGNLLLGGVIGLAIDAASGAISRYPDSIMVALPPEAFASDSTRHAFFDERLSDTRRRFEERAAAIRGACTPEARESCNARLTALDREREEELARLNRLRQEARIGT